MARNITTPSWRYRASLRAAGVDEAPYVEHLAYLASHVDTKLYVREPGTAGSETLTRYGAEVYSEAVRFAAWRRASVRAADATDLDVAFPRVAVCRLPGSGCGFRGPCLLDGEDVRGEYQLSDPVGWSDAVNETTTKQEAIRWQP